MFTLSLSCAVICGLASLAGGFIDAISGGGGLLPIPALLLTGVPPHLALGTNKLGAFLGTTIALFNFGKHGLVAWRVALWGIPFSFAGSWLGSLFALYLDAAVLGKVLVALLPFAMLGALLPVGKRENYTETATGPRFWLLLPLICLSIGCYDGFFGPGAGSFFILLLYWLMRMDLIGASATAKAFNLASNVSAAISFIWHGAIIWQLGLIMAVCFVIGNWAGSQFAVHAGSNAVRKFLIVSLFLLLATLIWQYFLAPLFAGSNS